MTAIVGMLCVDGVVIGSDSAITFGSGQSSTIQQTGEKIFIIGGSVIVSGSGEVGFQQRFCQIVKTLSDQGIFKKPHNTYMDIGREISHAAHKDFAHTFAQKGTYCALVAYPKDDLFHLCEFTLKDFQPEWKDKNVRFASLGCGQPITDPFLGFMKKVFWHEGEQPNIAQAKFVIYWTLSHVCELNPGGIKEPIQMAQLSKNEKGQYKATKLGEVDLQEHLTIMGNAIEYLRGFQNQITGKTAESIPSMSEESNTVKEEVPG